MHAKEFPSASIPPKKSCVDSYYAEVQDDVKNAASKLITSQFEKIREAFKWPNGAPQIETSVIAFSSPSPSIHRDIKEKPQWQSSVSSASDRDSFFAHVAHGCVPVPSHIVPKRAPRKEKNFIVSSPRRSGSPYHHYHFHGDKVITPAQMRKELYLHHDMFLISQDDDVAQAVLHHTHPHASKHPELEFRQCKAASISRPKSVNPVITLPDRSDMLRTLGSSSDSHGAAQIGASPPQVHTFRGLKTVSSSDSFRQELHLHHDLFLASRDEEVAEAVLSITKRRQEHVSRYPHESDDGQIDYSLRPDVKNARCTVPSHVVKPLSAERQRSASAPRMVRGARFSPAAEAGSPSSTALSTTATTPAAEPTSAQSKLAQSTSASAVSTSTNFAQCVPTMTRSRSSLALDAQCYTAAVKKLSPGSSASLVPTRGGDGPRIISPTTVSDISLKILESSSKSPLRTKKAPTPTPRTTATASATTSSATAVRKDHVFSTQQEGASSQNTTKQQKHQKQQKQHKQDNLESPPHASNRATASNKSLHSGTSRSISTHSAVNVSAKATYTRPLTAAEYAAAKSLSTKLTAANLAYHREGGAEIKPFRKMSRALSQLVYNVREPAAEEE